MRSLWLPSLAWVVTRVALETLGALSQASAGLPVHWVTMWVQWDANYYLSLLNEGYVQPPIVTGWESGQSAINFFPLLPMGTWVIERVAHQPVLAGLVFSNLCLVLAGIGLHRMVLHRSGEAQADGAVLALFCLPGSFILSGFMTESLFLAISVWSYHLLATGRRGPAMGLGALLSITRLTGVLLAAGFAVDWLRARWSSKSAPYTTLLGVFLMPLPLMLFMAYQWVQLGDGIAFLHSQFAFWEHRASLPFANFFLFTSGQPRLVFQSAVALPLLACLLWYARRLRLGEVVFTILTIASFASSASAAPSLLRYMLSLYPVYLAIGALAARGPGGRLLLIGMATLDGGLMMLWSRGVDALI